MDELAAYFYEHILLPLVRYEGIKHDGEMGSDRDVRAALDVATSLYHLREHIPAPHQKSRQAIAAFCRDYDLLGDVVNATKHADLNRGAPQISSADDISQLHVVTRFTDEHGEYVHEEKRVVVKLRNGTERDLFDVLINVHDFWVQELESIGAKPAKKTFSNPSTGLVLRENAKQIRLQITQGVRWQHTFRLQQYNYDEQIIEPVDLSNRENIIFTLREPPSYDIELRSSTGVVLTRKLQLTPDQAQALDAMKSEEDRNAYLFQLAQDHGIQRELLQEYAESVADKVV